MDEFKSTEGGVRNFGSTFSCFCGVKFVLSSKNNLTKFPVEDRIKSYQKVTISALSAYKSRGKVEIREKSARLEVENAWRLSRR